MGSSLLKATAVATVLLAVLAATAEAAPGSYIPTIDAADFFLWVAANAIVLVIWLLSSSRRGRTDDDDDGDGSDSSWAAAAGHDAVDSSMHMYTSSSEYEAFSDAGSSARRALDAPATSRRLPRDREARAARRADRPRVRKKPAGGHDLVAPSPRAVFAAAAREPDDEVLRRHCEETPVAAEPSGAGGNGADEDDDVSMDSLWDSIVQRRAARPVVVRKSESWGNEEQPRLKRVAETAATTARREMRKSVSAVSDKAAAPQQPQTAAPAPAARQMGWRTRDVLVAISPDELLRRAESFIRRQHEHLRLQRQESEQRQLQLQRRLHAPALIRV